MIDGFPALISAAPTVATALALLYLVFTGRLIVRSEHKEMIRLLEARNTDIAEERDTWRAASEAKDGTIKTLAESNGSLMETAQFSTKVMSAIQLNAGIRNVP